MSPLGLGPAGQSTTGHSPLWPRGTTVMVMARSRSQSCVDLLSGTGAKKRFPSCG
jgi:hypothetical protein